MGLIQCPECQNTVSDKAAACPKCGYPIASEVAENTVKKSTPENNYTQENDEVERTVYRAGKDSGGIAKVMIFLVIISIIILFINKWLAVMFMPLLVIIMTAVLLTYAGQKELYFTNKKVVGRNGFIAQKALNSPLDKINNLSVIQTPLGKTIEITTSSDKHTFYYIANADEFRDKLMKEIDIYKDLQLRKCADYIKH